MSKLSVSGLKMVYHRARTGESMVALTDVNLDVGSGTFMALVGPSGCGKTTFIKIIDGLIKPTSGRIAIDGVPVTGPGGDRAMVFQDASLLPWRTVRENVMFGLECRGIVNPGSDSIVMELLRQVGIEKFANHYPHELSGGMQQRCNIARALAVDPQVLIMDEPFAALDAQTREIMQMELLRIWRTARKTVLFVTHQINEAVFLADQVAIFSGRPGTIKAVVDIDLDRPRTLAIKRTSRFLDYEDEIWRHIEAEVRFASEANL